MDKNTIWAVVLSTVVIIAAFILQPILFPNAYNKVPVETESTEEVVEVADLSDVLESTEAKESVITDENENSEIIQEQTFTIRTDKAEIVLTNKGGDIVSYELVDHKDMDTGKGVQISDNISDMNRTCAIALGTVDSRIINDVFETEKIDDYTYLFKKTLVRNGKKFTLGKRYTFKPGEYLFKLDILIHSDDNSGLNSEGVAYTLRTSPQIGPHFDPKKNRYENRQYVAYNGSKYKKIILANGQFKRYDKDFIWNGIAGKYFVELMVPEAPETINAGYYSSKVEVNDYANAQAFIERRAFSGSDVKDTYYMYFGPRNDKDLKRYNVAENNTWGFGGKKISECIQTSGLLNWLEVILKWCLELLHKFIKNWGICIIILTIILKLVMFPLSKKQSLGTLKMQQLQPKMQAIQEKYKNDQQRLQAETAKLYKEAGYNPASGCLPMLFQFLVLFAMYNLFNNYFEFRGSMFIPNWITDLTMGDSIHTFNFNIPLLGNQLRLLPVIYLASQLLFGKITNNGGATAGTAQSASTMKFMTYGMPIMFFFLFYNAPSGLLLYWTVSNIFQMGQQIIINKMMAEKKAEIENTTSNKKLPPKAKAKNGKK